MFSRAIPKSSNPIPSVGFMPFSQHANYTKSEDFFPTLEVRDIDDDPEYGPHQQFIFTPRDLIREGHEGQFSGQFKIRVPRVKLIYQHDPLPTPSSHIRLATILPGKGFLKCRLRIQPFPSKIPYTCLSYVWGQSERYIPLMMETLSGDQAIGITESLLVALYHLRHPRKPVTMWIDSVCINQEDIVEKGSQVALMGDIYRQATKLLSWLGPAANSGPIMTKNLNLLYKTCIKAALLYKTKYPCIDRHGEKMIIQQFSQVDWNSLAPIFRNLYWTRAWIIQEMALRPHLYSTIETIKQFLISIKFSRSIIDMLTNSDRLQYGRWKINFYKVFLISRIFAQDSDIPSATHIYHLFSRPWIYNRYGLPSETLETYHQFLFLDNDLSCHATSVLSYLDSPISKFHRAFFWVCSKFEARYQRDYFYALLGICGYSFIKPDYQKPEKDVQIEIADLYIKSARYSSAGLNFSSLNPALSQNEPGESISWLPWGKSSTEFTSSVVILGQDANLWGFSRLDCRSIIFDPQEGKLSVRCLYQSHVTQVFSRDHDISTFKSLRIHLSSKFWEDKDDYEAMSTLESWFEHALAIRDRKHLLAYLDPSLIDEDPDSQVIDEPLKEAINSIGYGLLPSDEHTGLAILEDGNIILTNGLPDLDDVIMVIEGVEGTSVLSLRNNVNGYVYKFMCTIVGISLADLEVHPETIDIY